MSDSSGSEWKYKVVVVVVVLLVMTKLIPCTLKVAKRLLLFSLATFVRASFTWDWWQQCLKSVPWTPVSVFYFAMSGLITRATIFRHPRFPHLNGDNWYFSGQAQAPRKHLLADTLCVWWFACLQQPRAAPHPVLLQWQWQCCLKRCDFLFSCPDRSGKLLTETASRNSRFLSNLLSGLLAANTSTQSILLLPSSSIFFLCKILLTAKAVLTF